MGMDRTSVLEKTATVEDAVPGRFRLVKMGSSDDKVTLAVDADSPVIGVLQTTTSAANQIGNIMLMGISTVKCGGAIAAGMPVSGGADGKAVQTTTATKYVVGIALKSGAADDEIPVLISQGRV